MTPGIPELLKQIDQLNSRIIYLTGLSYPVSNVFITFDQEKHKRTVLEKMGIGQSYALKNDVGKLPSRNLLFRDEHVLLVREADEPSGVKWKDLNTSLEYRRCLTVITSLVTILALYFAVEIVISWRGLSRWGSSYLITTFNVIFPILALFMTGLEGHHSESDFQRSQYFKIAVFLVGNLFLATWISTPFTSTIADSSVDPEGLVLRLNALFISEITLTALLQSSDYMGIFHRHIMAPRAKTQDAMNFYMRGGEIEMAERYASMTRLLFLALWGSSVYPGGFFMCWVAMGVKYWLDRLSLMRHWKRLPKTGPETAELTNKYFFAYALVMTAYVSLTMSLGMPFDNLCNRELETVPVELYGNWTFRRHGIGDVFQVFDNSTLAYRRCVQDVRSPHSERDDFFAWRDDRLGVFVIFDLVAGTFFLLGLLYYLGLGCYTVVSPYKYHGRGDDQLRGYSELPDGVGIYIPQVVSSHFSFPLIACRTDELHECVMDWHNPDLDYSHCDMTKDVERLLLGHILRLCNNVLGINPETMLSELLERDGDPDSRFKEESGLPTDMEALLREKVQTYFKMRSIFSIVKEWHHCAIVDNKEDVQEDASMVDKEGIEVVDSNYARVDFLGSVKFGSSYIVK